MIINDTIKIRLFPQKAIKIWFEASKHKQRRKMKHGE